MGLGLLARLGIKGIGSLGKKLGLKAIGSGIKRMGKKGIANVGKKVVEHGLKEKAIKAGQEFAIGQATKHGEALISKHLAPKAKQIEKVKDAVLNQAQVNPDAVSQQLNNLRNLGYV